jgi:hypothetical protein
MTVQEQIDFFFAPPLPQQVGMASPLHLLRRELQLCLVGEVISEDVFVSDPRRNRVFASGMVIMAGIDLLAKFYAGSDQPGEVGARFTAFASRFIFPAHPEATTFSSVLYELRNPLVHSFTLNSKKRTVILVTGERRGRGVVRPVTSDEIPDPQYVVVSLDDLFVAFIRAITAYEVSLRDSASLRGNFERMFVEYGGMRVDFQS